MDSNKPIKIGVSSSLIDLKAELLRKKQQLTSSKSRDNRGGIVKTTRKSDLLRAKSKDSKSNKGVEGRSQKDKEKVAEEEKKIEQSKSILEAKAKLYDKMQKGALLLADDLDEDDDERGPSEAKKLFSSSLINFQQKAIDEMKEKRMKMEEEKESAPAEAYPVDEDEWIEFTDALGRTRRCLKTDLPSFIDRDEKLSRPENPGICLSASADDRLREMKRERWELEAEILAAKDKVHYQDITFDEVRDHGTGYYAFSKDEAVRAQQMKELKKLSEETEAQRKKIKKDKKGKKSALKERLRKIKNKKRAKAGLPPLPEDEDDSEEEEDKDEVKEEEDKELTGEKKPEIRAWDVGKSGVFGPKPSTFDELDEKWLRDRRSDRNPEFAPPTSIYSEGGLRKQQPSNSSRVPLPTSYSSSSSSFGKYSNFVKSADSLPPSTPTTSPVVIEPPAKPFNPPQTFWKQRKDTQVPRPPPQKPIPIVDETPAPILLSSEEFDRGRGSEVAPPPTFEYYHGDNKPKPRRQPATTDPAEMMDAVSAGLKALRDQFENKGKTGGDNKDFL